MDGKGRVVKSRGLQLWLQAAPPQRPLALQPMLQFLEESLEREKEDRAEDTRSMTKRVPSWLHGGPKSGEAKHKPTLRACQERPCQKEDCWTWEGMEEDAEDNFYSVHTFLDELTTASVMGVTTFMNRSPGPVVALMIPG